MRKYFIVGSILILFLATGCGCSKKNSEEEKKEEKKQSVILDDQIVNDLSFESFAIVTDSDNVTHIYFEVINNTENAISFNSLSITLYEGKNKVLSMPVAGYNLIEAGESIEIRQNLDLELYDVDKVEYTVE